MPVPENIIRIKFSENRIESIYLLDIRIYQYWLEPWTQVRIHSTWLFLNWMHSFYHEVEKRRLFETNLCVSIQLEKYFLDSLHRHYLSYSKAQLESKYTHWYIKRERERESVRTGLSRFDRGGRFDVVVVGDMWIWRKYSVVERCCCRVQCLRSSQTDRDSRKTTWQKPSWMKEWEERRREERWTDLECCCDCWVNHFLAIWYYIYRIFVRQVKVQLEERRIKISYMK